jgi:hypothetical protein
MTGINCLKCGVENHWRVVRQGAAISRLNYVTAKSPRRHSDHFQIREFFKRPAWESPDDSFIKTAADQLKEKA